MNAVFEVNHLTHCYGQRLAVDDLSFSANLGEVLGLVAGQISGVLYLSVGVGMLVGLFVWLVDGMLVYFAIRSFNRSRLLINMA